LITLTFAAIQFCFFTRLPWSFYHSIGQGISAVGAFFELLSQPSLSVQHPEENKQVAPAELCPILKRLYRILIKRFVLCIITTLHIWRVYSVLEEWVPQCRRHFSVIHFTAFILLSWLDIDLTYVQGAPSKGHSSSPEGRNDEWSSGKDWDGTKPCILPPVSPWKTMI
jgi:hypothetical protein